jgi:hypothetical protein
LGWNLGVGASFLSLFLSVFPLPSFPSHNLRSEPSILIYLPSHSSTTLSSSSPAKTSSDGSCTSKKSASHRTTCPCSRARGRRMGSRKVGSRVCEVQTRRVVFFARRFEAGKEEKEENRFSRAGCSVSCALLDYLRRRSFCFLRRNKSTHLSMTSTRSHAPLPLLSLLSFPAFLHNLTNTSKQLSSCPVNLCLRPYALLTAHALISILPGLAPNLISFPPDLAQIATEDNFGNSYNTTSSGTNSQGNSYSSRDFGYGSNAYQYVSPAFSCSF